MAQAAPAAVADSVERWPIPTPLPVGPVNAYRLVGPRPCLIDCGPRLPEASTELAQRLRDRPVRVLVLTHEHADHAGLARWLQRVHGVEVWLHRRERTALARWQEEAASREADYERGLATAGIPPALREYMRYGGRRFDAWGESVDADRTFEGGERLELGGHAYEVVDAPGHTPGSFLLSDGRTTFSGDTLLETITPNALSVREKERGGLADYLDTLARIEARDWGFVMPGHGRAFEGAADVIRRAREHARRRRERILNELGPAPMTAWQIVQRLFPRLPDNQAFLAASEALGHLEILRREGLVAVERPAEADLYRSAAG